MAQIRLDKYLADMQTGTRSEVKKYIRKGLVKVDSEVVKKPEQKVDTEHSEVLVEGRRITYQSIEYYMLNKPQGVVSATVDSNYQTVVDLIVEKNRTDLFPVGRLDIDTEGLLLITNDGVLCHNLLAPGKHVDKCYYVIAAGEVTQEDVMTCRDGVEIGTMKQPERTRPAELTIEKITIISQLPKRVRKIVSQNMEKDCRGGLIRRDDKIGANGKTVLEQTVSEVYLTVQEGKFHQVKRMFERLGKPVLYLKRVSMGGLILDDNLEPGEYRALTGEELEKLRSED